MSTLEIKRASKWRRYLNIILGINNNKQPRKISHAINLSGDPSSIPRGISGDRISDSTMTTDTGFDEEGTLLYCTR